MTDVWEIAQYVEGHPDNYPQRWRLAKKLYLAWEYRLALEHLQILKNEWEERENVRRYLAATYYRLKRYKDAIKELEEAIEIWPEQLGFREQLALALNADGREKEALEVWKAVIEIDPEHRQAKRKLKKAKRKQEGKASPNGADEDREPGSVDEALAARPEDLETMEGVDASEVADAVCPRCGTRNSSENGYCWRCQSPLGADPVDRPVVTLRPRPVDSGDTRQFPWPVAIAAFLLIMFTLDIYLTSRNLPPAETNGTGAGTASSVFAFLAGRFAQTRILSGFALLAGWPVILHVAAYLVGAGNTRPNALTAIALFAATTTYALSWLPGGWLWALPVVAGLASSVPILLVLGLPRTKAWALAAVQLVSAGLIPCVVVVATYGVEFVSELPAVFRHESALGEAGPLVLRGETPTDFGLVWRSTGSDWLDRQAAIVGFVVDTGPFEKRVFVEIKDANDRLVVFEEVKAGHADFVYGPVTLGMPYRIQVSGREVGVDVTVALHGVLTASPIDASSVLE